MFYLKDVRIRTVLATGFVLIIIASLAANLTGRSSLSFVGDELRLLAADRTVKVVHMRDIRDNLNVIARAVLTPALIEDDTALKAEVARFKQYQTSNAKLVESLQTTVIWTMSKAVQAPLQAARSAHDKVSAKTTESSAASVKQLQGVCQVVQSASEMGQVTQQNTTLDEESAAAADSLKARAQMLALNISVFKLSQGISAATPPLPPPVAKTA